MIARFIIVGVLALPSCFGPEPKTQPLHVTYTKSVLYGEQEPHPAVPADTQLNLVMSSPKQSAKDRCKKEYQGQPSMSGTILVCRNVKRGL